MPIFDQSTTTFSGSQGTTNNTTPVTVITGPSTGAPVFVVDEGGLSVLNRDTASATVILTLTAPSTIIERITMQSGDKWVNGGPIVVGPGQTLTIELAGSVTTNQLTYTSTFFQASG